MDFLSIVIGGQLNAGNQLDSQFLCYGTGFFNAAYGIVVGEGDGGKAGIFASFISSSGVKVPSDSVEWVCKSMIFSVK